MPRKRLKVTEVITQSGLKKSYIANELGVSVGYFSNFIKDPGNWSVRQSQKFCQLVGLSFDEIDWSKNF